MNSSRKYDEDSENMKVCRDEYKPNYTMAGILYFIIMLFAIYLSFLCNKGFDLGGFLMAIFFPYIYILYKLATVADFCGLDKIATPA